MVSVVAPINNTLPLAGGSIKQEFIPLNGSTLPLIVASVNTFVVSWKEAADKKESVSTDDLEIPNRTGLNVAGVFPDNKASLFIFVIFVNDN